MIGPDPPDMNPHYSLRSYNSADARAVVDVVNADADATMGLRRALVDGAGNVRLRATYRRPARRSWLSIQRAEVAGYVYLADRESTLSTRSAARCILTTGGKASAVLWGWAEQRATVPDPAPRPASRPCCKPTSSLPSRARRLFTRCGYTQAREWLHLQIDLAAPPAQATRSDGLTLRPIDLDDDWDILGPAMDDAFADHWGAVTLPESDTPDDTEAAGEDLLEDESYSNAAGLRFMLPGPEPGGRRRPVQRQAR